MAELGLFVWVKENFAIITSFLVVLWAMIVYWFRLIISRFLTTDQIVIKIDERIQACKLEVDKIDKTLLEEIHVLGTKIDHLDDRRRDDAMTNSAAHERILTIIAQQKNDD